MIIKLTKKATGKHILTIVRDDETISRGFVVPGFGPDAIPHDLAHAIVENTLGFTDGVFGKVNHGADIKDLLTDEFKKTTHQHRELMLSEAIVTTIQAAISHSPHILDNFSVYFQEQLDIYKQDHFDLTDAQLESILDEIRTYEKKWKQIGIDKTIEYQMNQNKTV